MSLAFFATEKRLSSRREAIAYVKAFGQTEILQLSDIELELILFLPHQPAQVPRTDSRMLAEHLECAQGPGPASRMGVQAVQPPLELSGLIRIGRERITQRNSWVSAQGAKLDTIDLAFRSTRQLRQQGLTRFIPGTPGVFF